MSISKFSKSAAAAFLLLGVAAAPGFSQNGTRTLPARTVIRVNSSTSEPAPSAGPVQSAAPKKASKEASLQTGPRLGSHESQRPTKAEMDIQSAEGAGMGMNVQTIIEDKGLHRDPQQAPLPEKKALAQNEEANIARVLSSLPKTFGGPEPAVQAQPLVRPQIDERAMAPAIYPLVDDYSEVFITTYDKPTQKQADRLAAIYLGRAPLAGELTLCIPSEGFTLRLSGSLAADAAAREKARALLLAEADVITITPSVKEGPETYYLPGQVLANCKPEMTLDAVQKMVRPLGAQVLEEHDQQTMRVFVIQVPKGADPRQFAEVVKKLGVAPEVVPNVQATLKKDEIPNDPSYDDQWWLHQLTDSDIDAERGWDMFNQNIFDTYVSVAVVDGDGYDMAHSEWGGGAYILYNEYDAVNDDNDPSPESLNEKHGTPCAGLIAAVSDNSQGVASVGWNYTYVVPIRIGFNHTSTGNFSTNATIISRASSRVIGSARMVASSHSYSGGGTFYSSTVLPYYQNMYNNPRGGKGAVFCASAGNNNLQNEANYPASYSFAVTVAASNSSDTRASFSNYGSYVEVTAPGVNTYTLDRTGSPGYTTNDFTYFGGTSAACPITAGVCAAIARQRSSMGRDSIMMILMSTCEKVGGYAYTTNGTYGTKSNDFGYGRINMASAVGRANGYQYAISSIQGNLTCGSNVSGTTVSFGANANSYYGTTWNESGPDANWTLTVPTRAAYTIELTNTSADLDIFLLEHEWASSTIAYGNSTISGVVLEPGVYHLVVDGYNGASGTYSLSVSCVCIPTYGQFNCASGDFIKSVRINRTSFDSSGCTSLNGIVETQYPYNYTFRPSYFTVYANSTNFLEIHSGVAAQNYMIFIDYDENGSFEASEKIYQSPGGSTKLVTTFNGAHPDFPAGQYRKMRIISTWSGFSSATNSCQTNTYGETEDHMVYCSPSGWPIAFGSSGNDYVRGVVRDGAANAYISLAYTGTVNFLGITLTSPSPTRRAMAIAKVNNAGFVQWVKSVGNTTFDMEPRGVNVDGAGNPYWAGSFAGTVSFPNAGAGIPMTAAGSHDAFVARFDPATGNCVWARRVGGPGNDYLYGCFVSNSGNVYAGGSYTGAITFATSGGNIALPNAGGLDGFIVKFDPAGTGLWATRLGSTANDEVKSIEYMGGDLVACGYMGNNCQFPGTASTLTLPTIAGSKDGWAARINSTGKFVWVRNFGTTGGDEAMSVCMDPLAGNVFTAAQVGGAMTFNGVTQTHKGHNDIAVVGWNFYTIAPIWGSQVGSGAGDVPSSIRWDGERLVVAGYASGSFNPGIGTLPNYGLQDAVVLRYSRTTGVVSSGLVIGGTGNDQAEALWCDVGNREEFVGGSFQNQIDFYTTTPRVSKGLFDGFVSRHFPPTGARLGIEEVEASAAAGSLKAYPVPARSELRIVLGQDLSGTPEVVDLRGARQNVNHRLEGGEAVLDVSMLKPGFYVVRVGGRNARFVKE